MTNVKREEGINWLAVDVIGKSDPGLTSLKMADTLKELPDEARPLRALIMSPAAETIVEERIEASKTADKCQKSYKFWGRLAVLATLIGASVGIVWVIQDAFTGFKAEGWQWLFFFEAAIALFGVTVTKRLTRGNFHMRWMRARVTSEQTRRQFFDYICLSPQLADFDTSQRFRVDLLSLQLEYFRRYQLDLQYNYFCLKARTHRRITRFFKTYGLLAGSVGLVAMGAAFPEQLDDEKVLMFFDKEAFLAGVDQIDRIVWLVIAMILPFFQTAMIDLGSLDNNVKNATRYKLMKQHLEGYRGRLDEVRRAAAAGRADVVAAYITEINDLLSHENAEWSEVHQSGRRPQFDAMYRRHEKHLPAKWKQGLRMVGQLGRKSRDFGERQSEGWM